MMKKIEEVTVKKKGGEKGKIIKQRNNLKKIQKKIKISIQEIWNS